MCGATALIADVLLLHAGVEALTLRQYAPDAALDEPGAYLGSGKAGAWMACRASFWTMVCIRL